MVAEGVSRSAGPEPPSSDSGGGEGAAEPGARGCAGRGGRRGVLKAI